MSLLGSIGGALGAINPVAAAGTFIAGGGLDMISANQQNQAAIGQQNAAENFSASQVSAQEAYQTQMSDTAHQREVADLKAAGLNPLLSANAGASTPFGAAATGVAAPVVPEIGPAVSSARDTMNMLQNMMESNSRILKNTQDTSKSQSETYLADLRSSVADQTARQIQLQNDMLGPEADIYAQHPFLTGWSKVLADRGIGAGSALDATRAAGALDLLP